MSREIDKIKARLGSIGPRAIASCPGSVRRLLEEDLPKLIRNYDASFDFITALDHVENYDKQLTDLRQSLDLAAPL